MHRDNHTLRPASTAHHLIGRRRGETWMVLAHNIPADYQPSPVCIASWPELRIVRVDTPAETERNVARWKDGVLVGRSRASAPHGACP